MQERHKDRELYFKEQGLTTAKYVVPYVNDFVSLNENTKVLEVGCGEGGNMTPFLDLGCETVGVDISPTQIEKAEYFLKTNKYTNYKVVAEDIYKVSPEELGEFDLIFLRDVIEHIPNQEQFFREIGKFLKVDGVLFFGFPPWRMPFGGHQQICNSKFLSVLPYFHLLPKFLYKPFLKLFGESDGTILSLEEIKDTGISIRRFNKGLRTNSFAVVKSTHYLINPNYETKFNLKGRILPSFFKIPHLSDFYTTAVYSVVKKKS